MTQWNINVLNELTFANTMTTFKTPVLHSNKTLRNEQNKGLCCYAEIYRVWSFVSLDKVMRKNVELI